MNTRRLLLLAAMLTGVASMYAHVDFDKYFEDSTLRLDYIFAGNDSTTEIYFDEAVVTDGWAGRRCNLDYNLLRGNGDVTVTDCNSGDVIYTNSFSTLFQEWQHTAEAAEMSRAFEATMLVPMPRADVDVTVSLYDNRGNTVATHKRHINPSDIMLRRISAATPEHRYIHRSGSPRECVDIAIVAEGYTADEAEKFYADAARSAEALLSHEPFASMADRFNILAVFTPSAASGPSEPGKGVWHDTAHRSHYDTFYMERYLTTPSIHHIHESIGALPAEHIILMVNTPRYGGSGILNQLTIAVADHPVMKQVLVHEFGHAYGGLADEYFTPDDDTDTTYPTDVEPWEPNITTLVDFPSKWADMIDGGEVGVYEGAGYRAHGVYRPVDNCRMRVNNVDHFCPVCSRAIVKVTDWYLNEAK